jgi:hypothetical protein
MAGSRWLTFSQWGGTDTNCLVESKPLAGRMNPNPPFQYDLSELCACERARNSRWTTVRTGGGVLVGSFIVIVGVYAGLQRSPVAVSSIGSGGVLIATGLLVAVSSWWYEVSIYDPVPDLVLVASDSLAFGRKASPSSFVRMGWEDPLLRLGLHDRSRLHAQLGAGDKYGEYRVVPASGPSFPVPRLAFEQVVRAARAQRRRQGPRDRTREYHDHPGTERWLVPRP